MFYWFQRYPRRSRWLKYRWILVLAVLLPSAVSADLVLTFDLASRLASPQGPDGKNRSQLIVRLAENEMRIEKGSQEEIYDFKNRRIFRIDRAKQTYTEASLLTIVGFRDYELKNRKYLNDLWEGVELEENPMPLLLSEHELSASDRDARHEIERLEQKEHIVFMGSGKELLSYSKNRIKIPERYHRVFVRFFRYEFGGHPKIVDELANSAGIPRTIALTRHRLKPKTFELHLLSVEESESSFGSLNGLVKASPVHPPLLQLESLIDDDPQRGQEVMAHRVLQQARAATERGDLVEAMLRYFEYSLATGDSRIPWTQEERAAIVASDPVQRLFVVIQNPNSAEEAKSFIQALEALRQKHPKTAHILKIFESNTRGANGEAEMAETLMIEALAENPYVASAWKDLGDLYFRRYLPDEAWFCWEMGRKVSPTHPLLVPIQELESHLQSKYSALF